MIVVFFTSLSVGQETRFISARTSRRNCASRPMGPIRGPLRPRSRRAPRPSAPSPKRAVRGDGSEASGLSISSMVSLTFLDTQLPSFNLMAGVPGFEPGLSVLETDVLTVDTIPLRHKRGGDGETGRSGDQQFGRVSASPLLRVSLTSFPYGQCVCGNADRIFETPTGRAWFSYSLSLCSCGSCSQCTGAQCYRAA